MGLSNGFGAAGAAGAAGGGPPSPHGATHQPGGSDPLGPLAGQSFFASTAPATVVDGSVWVPSDASDDLRGEWLVWHSWRNGGSGRWVGQEFFIGFGSDSADGSYLEIAGGPGPSSDLAFLCKKDMVILGVVATRSNDGPATKTISVVADKNTTSPLHQFSASKGATYKSGELDIPLSADQLLGVWVASAGDPCRIGVSIRVAFRRG